jgi:hypothetical protein
MSSKNAQHDVTRRRFFGFVTVSMGALLAASPALAHHDDDNNQGDEENGRWFDWLRQLCGWNPTPNPKENCFLAGTRIRTIKGDVPIETLRIGDLVATISGEWRPVRWIGRRRYRRSGSQWPRSVLPVRISKFAIDEFTPQQDLLLSAGHSLFVGGVLIPVSHLINGVSIVQDEMRDAQEIQYLHLELEAHDIVFAEGTPTESLQVKGARDSFDNSYEHKMIYGESAPLFMAPYAPVAGYYGGRAVAKALLRRIASPVIDRRDQIQRTRDHIVKRAKRAREQIAA